MYLLLPDCDKAADKASLQARANAGEAGLQCKSNTMGKHERKDWERCSDFGFEGISRAPPRMIGLGRAGGFECVLQICSKTTIKIGYMGVRESSRALYLVSAMRNILRHRFSRYYRFGLCFKGLGLELQVPQPLTTPALPALPLNSMYPIGYPTYSNKEPLNRG